MKLVRFTMSVLFLLTFVNQQLVAATRYSVATGNWGSTSTWSATSGGAAGASVPGANDVAIIEGNRTVTVNANASCTDVTIASGSLLSVAGVNFTSTGTTTVLGEIRHTSTNGTKTFGNVLINTGTWRSNANETYGVTNLTLTSAVFAGTGTDIFNVSGNLLVNAGTTSLDAMTLNVTGTTTINGTVNITSTAGTKVFTGLVTVGSTGILNNNTVNEPLEFRGGLTCNGTINSGTGNYSFTTNAQALNGTMTLQNVVVTTITLTNNGILNLGSSLTGNGNFTQGAGSVLNVTGNTNTVTTFNATTNSNVVNYTGAAQNVRGVNYSTLQLSGSGAKTLATGTTAINADFILSGTATTTTVANLAVGGNLQINNGTTLTTGSNFTLGVTGTADVSGSFVLGGTSAKTFTGDVSINNTGVWNESAVSAINFQGSLLNNASSFITNTGTHTFSGATKTISGSTEVAIPNMTFTGAYSNNATLTSSTLLTVTGTTLTNNATINATTALSGTGGVTQGTNATLNLGGTSGITTLNATASGNTVNYNGAAQSVNATNYANLTLSGTNTKTLQTGTTTISGNLTFAGTASTTAVVGLTIGGDVIIGSGTTFNGATFTHSVAGNWTNNGGTFTPATSTVSFTGNSSQINGSLATKSFNNLVVNKTAGQTLSTGGGTTTITVNGNFTQTTGNFTAPATMTVGGTTTLTSGTYNAGTNLNLSGNFTNNSTGFVANSGTVSMNGSGFTIGGSQVTTFNSLTINNAGGTLLGQSVIVNNLLTLTAGRLTIGANNLTFGANALAVAGILNASNMIVATSTGQVRKIRTANGSYVFPIGDATGTPEYSPVTVNFISGTYAAGAYVSVNVTNTKHPNNSSVNNFLNRYWTVGQSGITAFSADVTATYTTADINGVEGNQVAARYTGTLPWFKYNALSTNTLSVTGLTAFGDFTGINNIPTLSTSPTSLSAFTYPLNNGPSQILSFNVSGTDLNENVIVYPTSNFEISALGGGNFIPVGSVTLAPAGGIVNAVPVYVRMKSGLPLGAVTSQNVTVTSTGATTVNVGCSGTVAAQPVVTLATSPVTDPVSLSGFSYNFKSASTTERTFTVTGTNLVGDVVITPPTNYEISLTTGTGFVSTPITITPTGGTLPTPNPRTIYVRLKSGLGIGNYNESITVTSTYAANKTVALSGVVNPIATLTTNISWLAGFIYSGTGPSAAQTFQLTGTNLGTNNVTVTPPTDFELSVNGTSWNTTAFTIAPTAGSVNQTIYARLRSNRTAGTTYGPQNVTLTATGAVVKTVALSGYVASAATILVSRTTLTGFGYLFGSGPSVAQSVTISGAVLSNNITVTPPANYEILNPTTGLYQSTAITLTRSGTTVAATEVFVRLKADLAAGDYIGDIVASSSPAANKTVTLTGKVFATPLITSSGGGNFCIGESVNLTSSGTDVQSQFWTGPNNFYANTANTTLSNVTESMSGSYTVTGNVVVGGNLIYNGDFELGNTGVGSSYTYVAPAANVLQPEDLYTIVALPSSVHSNFNSIPDHTAAPGTLQMVINGYRTAGVVVWSQSVPVVNNANYEFSYWLQTVVNGVDPAPSKLQLYVNGVMAGPIYTANPNSGNWTQYIYNTNAGSNNVLNLELINQTTAANGNDFALDDISFRQILSSTSTQNVTVSPSVVASVTVTYTPTQVNTNTPIVFTANPVNGGETPTYKWFVGGVEQVGQTASTFNYTQTTAGSLTVRCEMTSSITCAAPKPASDTKVITVTNPVNYWMGYIDTDWGKSANWTAGYVPATGDNVIYATVANFGTAAMRDLQLDKNRTIGSLINATIRRLVIPANLTLNCNSVITVTPPVTNPVTNAEDLIYVYASTTLPNGSIIYKNPQNIPAYGTIEMYSPASWDLSRPINQKYNWQYFGIPVLSLPALPTFYGAYVRQLLESDKDTATHWQALNNLSVLVPFKGYELCQKNANTLYQFKGQLVNSDFNSGQFAKTSGALYPGQHLFANPYTSAIDIRQIEFGSNVEATAYLYNTGTFISWRNNPNKSVYMETAVPGQYTSAPKNQAGMFPGVPRQIPSMGTFMVRILTANQSTPQSYVALNYNTVAMGNSERQRAKAASLTDEQTTTSIIVEGEFGVDRMWLMSHEMYSREFDNGFDGKKIIGNALSPQIYAVERDGNYQINSVDDINNTTLAFEAGQDNEYKMTFNHNDLTMNKYNKIFLHDLVENRIVDITQSGSEYTFNAVSASQPALRFKIIAQSNEDAVANKSLSKVYCSDNSLYVQNFADIQGKVYVYDISGRAIAVKSISANGNIRIQAPDKTIYIVKTVLGTTTETTKILFQ